MNPRSKYYPSAVVLAIAIAYLVLRGTGCTTAPVTQSPSNEVEKTEVPTKVVVPADIAAALPPPAADPTSHVDDMVLRIPAPSCCAKAWPGTTEGESHHPVRATGYTPENTTMEGGPTDRYGSPLRTLQDFLAGRASYVSTAMDEDLGRVKRKICIPELSAAFGKPIAFYVVDTGQAFKGKSWGRIDIANRDQAGAQSSKINRAGLTIVECRE